MNMEKYREYLFDTCRRIFAVDSPSGYTTKVMKLICEMSEEMGYSFELTKKVAV